MKITQYDVVAQVFSQGLSNRFEKSGISPVGVVNFVAPILIMATQPWHNEYTYHPDGEKPRDGEIFVFGSNLAGVHGAGAARAALEHYGAVIGVGKGIVGRSYALPTKDNKINSLGIDEIARYVAEFKVEAAKSPFVFFMTRVGCGLAGYSDEEIAPLFVGSPNNIVFPIEWAKYVSAKEASCR